MKPWLMIQGLLLAHLAGACNGPASRNPVFVNPASYLGRAVQVCGYVDGPNILESRDRRDWAMTSGVSILERGPLPPLFEGDACVEGPIEHLGCETQICTGAAFEYAIRINRIVLR